MNKTSHVYTSLLLILLGSGSQAPSAGEVKAPDGTISENADEATGDRYRYPANGRIPDQVDAEHWYLSAAESGDPFAWAKLGELYLLGGGGVRIDFTKARFWLLKAALSGIPRAQFHLGVIYAEALGTGYDWPRASYWLQAAVQNGSRQASGYLQAHDPAD